MAGKYADLEVVWPLIGLLMAIRQFRRRSRLPSDTNKFGRHTPKKSDPPPPEPGLRHLLDDGILRPRTRREYCPKPPTEAELERRAALAYAERFASTKTRSAVLRRTIRRRGPSEHDAALEAFALRLVERYSSSGLVDDLRFAETRAARLHRQGHPARAIAEKLRVAGVERADITSAIGESGASGVEGERAAALSYAKRRRLGPFRVGDPKPFGKRTSWRWLAEGSRGGWRSRRRMGPPRTTGALPSG